MFLVQRVTSYGETIIYGFCKTNEEASAFCDKMNENIQYLKGRYTYDLCTYNEVRCLDNMKPVLKIEVTICPEDLDALIKVTPSVENNDIISKELTKDDITITHLGNYDEISKFVLYAEPDLNEPYESFKGTIISKIISISQKFIGFTPDVFNFIK